MSRAEEALAPEGFAELLRRQITDFPLALEPDSIDRLGVYLSELDLWRRKINLTGALSAAELANHALESALGASLIPDRETVVDIGSGAGFPGLPIAVVRPDLEVTLLEPRAKRAAFLRHVARAVPVPNARIEEATAADLPEKALFQVAVSRAVTGVGEILQDATFLAKDGALLAWTTEPEALSLSLGSAFRFEKMVGVPGSFRKVIALYRRTGRTRRRR